MKLSDIKTGADVRKFLSQFYTGQVQALHGLIEKLPESLRPELKKLHDELNEALSGLEPLEQIPAAQEAAWSFNSLARAMIQIQEYAGGLLERLKKMQEEITGKATEFNSELALLADVLPSTREPRAEPLLGGGAPAAAATENKPKGRKLTLA